MNYSDLLIKLLAHFHIVDNVIDIHKGPQGSSLVWSYSDNKDFLVDLDLELNQELLDFLNSRNALEVWHLVSK